MTAPKPKLPKGFGEPPKITEDAFRMPTEGEMREGLGSDFNPQAGDANKECDELLGKQKHEIRNLRARVEQLEGERDRQYEANVTLIAKEGAALLRVAQLEAALELEHEDVKRLRERLYALAQPAESGGMEDDCKGV